MVQSHLDFPVGILITAGALLLLATLIRGLRLYISLGALRPGLFYAVMAHFVGVSIGFLTGAFVYEMIVILFFSVRHWNRAIPTLLSLMLLRGFDAVILLGMALSIASMGEMNKLIFFLAILLALIWVCIYSITPILHRFERNMLEVKTPFAHDIKIIQYSCKLRQSLGKLPWAKKGTIAMIMVMSMLAWLLEWLSVYLLLSSGGAAVKTVVDRVGRSVGIVFGSDHVYWAYNILMPFIYGASVLLALVWLVRRLGMKNFKRVSGK